ncbi:tRNA preQ1(34) S-adenosylmethionine ribosyltransferase-isomerase QueA [Peredibacter starrii]|uniref:S-adenosylmethionine:tRNA ribosyltransferase-isomerase n=1 Tax=Peredibacter starrii TaxID=28202 RepID=A0AAX4HKW8_9BACT|nr:tRNA preQ1(34) S-adenosylmethionine ribosyltransferase-isomerase QueA [Peredibacter starrii]WPU63895.1 tRNA preQ1(34) S-adenosylmethionine ribosyltransferase-isomerase QueA [Peredibacter starrii]
MTDFELSSYHFELPKELIADRPVPDRHSSKLLVYKEETGEIIHSTYSEITKFLPPHSTLVFNRSKVFPCRLIGNKPSGGEAEVFILSLLHDNDVYPAMIRAAGKRKVGDEFIFGNLKAHIVELRGGTFGVKFNLPHEALIKTLEEIGKIPIPPYIRGGESDEEDKRTYQTVYAAETGSVAAPTAGLHFSEELLQKIKNEGHEIATVTLHVGAGTFAPVKADNILDHKMHEEFFTIDKENLATIQKAKFRIAVGTTTLRTLESSWKNGNVQFDNPGSLNSTSIFLHPGKEVHSIDAMVTNFHLPESSLLMLVSALIGREKALEIYKIAIEKKYRFFSYGDGMLILRKGR